jgi:hypothetical protein
MPELLDSRWTPGALAITHLITVGFMLMIMVGAMFQILPVVIGASLPRADLLASIVHVCLAAGTISPELGTGQDEPGRPVRRSRSSGGRIGPVPCCRILCAVAGADRPGEPEGHATGPDLAGDRDHARARVGDGTRPGRCRCRSCPCSNFMSAGHGSAGPESCSRRRAGSWCPCSRSLLPTPHRSRATGVLRPVPRWSPGALACCSVCPSPRPCSCCC